jgi:hypothetical protein
MKDIPRPHDSSQEPQKDSPARAAIDDERLRAILRGSSGHAAPPNLLGGVQRRICERSRGRFYADGWSRSKAATSTYIITSLLVLGIFLLAYFVLLPSLPVK